MATNTHKTLWYGGLAIGSLGILFIIIAFIYWSLVSADTTFYILLIIGIILLVIGVISILIGAIHYPVAESQQ